MPEKMNTFLVHIKGSMSHKNGQWLKCNGTQGNAVPPLPIYGSKRSPTSDCYNAGERHHHDCQGPKPECTVPHL